MVHSLNSDIHMSSLVTFQKFCSMCMKLGLILLLSTTAIPSAGNAKSSTAKKVAVVAGIGVVGAGILALCLSNKTNLKSQTSDLRAIGNFASNRSGVSPGAASPSSGAIQVSPLPPPSHVKPPLDMSCLQPQQKIAYHVVALQTQLMVGALTCKLSSEYDAFVLRYRSVLLAERQVISNHLNGSRRGRTLAREDSFMTDLANHQSPSSRNGDAQYCATQRAIFSNLRNRSAQDLKQYAMANPQAMVSVCGR
jgi:hypothetical protein